jgi:hypothetical protein
LLGIHNTQVSEIKYIDDNWDIGKSKEDANKLSLLKKNEE